jgi:hypothetical protein
MIFAQRAVQRLNRVGGVDHLANAGREGKEWHDMLPGPAPGLANGRGSSLALSANR